MALATISAKVDSENKRAFEQFCEDTGMNVSVCINMFVKEVLRNHRLPFEVSADPFYSEKNIRYLEGIVRDIREGRAHFEEHELIEDGT